MTIPWGLMLITTVAFLLGFFLCFFTNYFVNKKDKKQKVIIVVEADSMKKMIDFQQQYNSNDVEIVVIDDKADGKIKRQAK